MSILVGLIALPAVASIDHGHGEWNGKKRIHNNKLECEITYIATGGEHYGDYEAHKWMTSMDHGDSPYCAKHFYDSGMLWWHVKPGSMSDWNKWKKTEGYAIYKAVHNFEKSDLMKNWKDPVVPIMTKQGTEDVMLSIPTADYKAYLTRVRLGVAEPLSTFLANTQTYGIYPDISTSLYAEYIKIVPQTTKYISTLIRNAP